MESVRSGRAVKSSGRCAKLILHKTIVNKNKIFAGIGNLDVGKVAKRPRLQEIVENSFWKLHRMKFSAGNSR